MLENLPGYALFPFVQFPLYASEPKPLDFFPDISSTAIVTKNYLTKIKKTLLPRTKPVRNVKVQRLGHQEERS